MRNTHIRSFIMIAVIGALGYASAAAAAADAALSAAVANPSRPAKAIARDKSRHPVEELTFFGITPKMNVVELWPGGGYWTDILGPYLAPSGHYTVVLPPSGGEDNPSGFRARLTADKARYGNVQYGTLGGGKIDLAPPGSADLILTFRNLHNWMDEGVADQVLAACFKALKAGGILGIEEHRGRTDIPQDPKAESGYVRQDYAVALIKKAGFVLVDSSEVNANPKDTKDWPKGVWTLPPSLAMGETDRAKYMAIGEGDNFVLKFQKPR